MYSRSVTIAARLQTFYPCIFLLTFVCAGQLLSESILCSSKAPWGVAVIAAVGLLLFRAKLFKSMLGFLLGILSSALSLHSFPLFLPKENYLSGAVTEIRYTKPGAVMFSLASKLSDSRLGKFQCKALHLPWRESSRLRTGATVHAFAVVQPLLRTQNPVAADRVLWRHGFSGRCNVRFLGVEANVPESLKGSIKRYVEYEVGSGERSGLLLAMSLGFRDVLSERTESAFRALGLSHLLVFSGYQVGLLFGIALYFLTRAGMNLLVNLPTLWSKSLLTGISLTLTVGLIALIGFEPSSVRAILSAALLCFADLFEFRVVGLQMLSAALLLGAIIEPGAMFEPSLQLTAAALLGIWLGSGASPWGKWAEILRISICASLCAGCVSFAWFGAFSVLSPFLNPIVAPILSCVGCPIVLFAVLLSPLDGGLTLNGLAWFFQQAAFLAVLLARSQLVEMLSAPTVSWSGFLIAITILLLRARRKYREELWQIGVY